MRCACPLGEKSKSRRSCRQSLLTIVTSQTIAQIQLTEEEAARYRDVPVLLNFHTGFYVFPVSPLDRTQAEIPYKLCFCSCAQPTDDNIIKLAFHDSGVVYHAPGDTENPVSTPRTVSSHGEDGLRVPQSFLKRLRSALRNTYPELAEKPFTATRLCW